MGAATGRRLSIIEAIMAPRRRKLSPEYYRLSDDPTQDAYNEGFEDGYRAGMQVAPWSKRRKAPGEPFFEMRGKEYFGEPRKKRKLSAWNKFVKANSKKPRFKYRNGKLNLKKMAVAFRKTPAGKKKRR